MTDHPEPQPAAPLGPALIEYGEAYAKAVAWGGVYPPEALDAHTERVRAAVVAELAQQAPKELEKLVRMRCCSCAGCANKLHGPGHYGTDDSCKADIILAAIRAALAERDTRIRTLEDAVRWALGENGDLAMPPEGRTPNDGLKPRVGWFWWRTELRKRALPSSGAGADTP